MRLNYFFRSPSRTVRLLLPAGVFLLVLAAGKNPGLARDKTCMEQDHRTFNVYIENDAIAGDDGQYTGGVKLTWSRYGLSALPGDAWLHKWMYPLVRKIGWDDPDPGEKALTFSAGQNIYTPDDIDTHELIEDDRPYAGITYVEWGFHKRFEHYMHTVGLFAGIVGPESGAEDIQSTFHDVFNSSEANGWDHQLKNEPVLGLVYDYKRKFFTQGDYEGVGSDIIFNVGGNLGNALTSINSGLLLRYGWNLPHDFGNFAIQPATCFNAEIEEKYCQRDERRFGVHVFCSANASVVLQDIFLDGNTFTDSHSVDKKPLVGTFAGGLCMITGPFKTVLAYICQTKAFDGQDDPQVYGSLNVSYHY